MVKPPRPAAKRWPDWIRRAVCGRYLESAVADFRRTAGRSV